MHIPMGSVSLSSDGGDTEHQPITAEVESFEDERAVIAVQKAAHAMAFKVGSECQVRFTDPKDGRFMGVSCVVELVERHHITVRVVTETKSANQRSSFRVSTACSDITARVGRYKACGVVDVSAAGICVDVPEEMRVGETVSVRITFDGAHIDGRFTVRRVGVTKNGAQVGLAADAKDSQLASALTRLTSAMQREQLRRRSRVAGGERMDDAEHDCADDVAADDTRDEVTSGGTEEETWIKVPASVLAGHALPGSVVSEDGSKVASRGQVLSLDEFNQLGKEGLYADGDWAGDQGDRRANQRSSCDREVRVVALQGKHVVRMRADLTDISRGGIGMRAPMALSADDYVVVNFSMTDEPCWVIGKVVHGGIGEGEVSCRLGMQFQLGTVQRERMPESAQEFAKWISGKAGAGAAA